MLFILHCSTFAFLCPRRPPPFLFFSKDFGEEDGEDEDDEDDEALLYCAVVPSLFRASGKAILGTQRCFLHWAVVLSFFCDSGEAILGT